MCSQVRQLFARIEDGQFSYCWLRFDMVCRRHCLVLSGITRLFPIDLTNGCDYSYRSCANNSFGSSPTPSPSIVHSSWLLGVFPDEGSLTNVDTSREFVPTLSIPHLVVAVTLGNAVRFGCFYLHQVL